MSSPTASSPWFVNPEPRWEATWRLIGFPHGGGGPQAFREWPKHLGEVVEMLAVHLPGRGSRLADPVIDDIDDLVESIVEAMRQCFDKPFAFIGHSVGALVAYEVARRLAELGLPTPMRLFASAHHAPQHAAHAGAEPMYLLGDDELVDVVRTLGLVPEEALADTELLSLILPPLRADFALSETYVPPTDATPLPCPITALGGTADPLLGEDDLREWSTCTRGGLTVRTFDGDHFYTTTRLPELAASIQADIAGDIAALPGSVHDGPQADYPRDATLHGLFREQAARTPEALALVDGDMRLTFAELDEDTDLLARALQARGVGVDDLVGIYLPTSADFVFGYLGALKAGGAYMPLDLALPPLALADVLDMAAPKAVVTDEANVGALPASWVERGAVVVLGEGWQTRVLAEDPPELDAGTDTGERELPGPDSLAYCVMSSGTTGRPKGMICPHRGAVNSYTWRFRHLPYEPEEREASNVFFVWEVLRPMLAGLPAYVISDDVIFDPPRLADYLRENKITRVLFTPSLLDQVLSTPGLDLESAFAHLRVLYLNGEVVPTALQRRFTHRFPHVALVNDYSISETHDVCTSDLSHLDARISPKLAPAGAPMDNVRLALLDDEMRPVPWGFVGEIYVGGDSLARGYLNQPELTAERFVRDPLRDDGSLLFRTGDSGRFLHDGRLEIHGRIAFMIKLRGYSIVFGAVETALLTHPSIEAAVVTTMDDPATGQPEHLIAYVVPTEGTLGGDGANSGAMDEDALVAELRAHLRDRLPHYAVPSYILAMESLPLSSTGKLNRRAMPDPRKRRSTKAAQGALGAADSQGAQATGRSEANVARLEGVITAVWSEVLGVDDIDPRDNFFDLGGHSLSAATVSAHLRQQDLDVSVVDIFQHPTATLLARSLDAAGHQGKAATVTRMRHVNDDEPIAVVGLSCRFPGAPDAEAFWANLRGGVRAIRELTPEELAARGVPEEIYNGPDYRRIGAILDDVESFDPTFWGVSRKEALLMDPQHRLFLECAWHALENAGHAPRTEDGSRTGVFGGIFLPTYLLHHLHGGGLLDPRDPMEQHLTEIGNDKDYVTTRVSHLLDLQGPSIAIQTSCSTSLVAVATACQSLREGQCDTALAGASSITFPQAGYQYAEGHISSEDGHVRPFDAHASGTILGDGVGVVVLKRLSDAVAAGDNVLAVITGFATNNDGAMKAGYSAPSVAGQVQVVTAAQEMAGADPDTFTYMECHGTGTLVGDPIEVRALTEVFRHSTDRRGYCAIGSVKGGIGHSNIAAGMAGLIKTVLALHHKEIPPVVDYETPNPALELETSPFYVADELRDWEAPEGAPRRAGISCFGIGGTNAHLILEEFDPTASVLTEASHDAALDAESSVDSATEQADPAHLLVLSAKTESSLTAARDDLVAVLDRAASAGDSDDALVLAAASHTLAVGREVYPHRLAAAGTDAASLRTALAKATEHHATSAAVTAAKRVVFMFPGQGSQYPAMGAGLYRDIPEFARHYDACADILAEHHGIDLRAVAFADAPAEGEADSAAAHTGAGSEFTKAYYAQPALFAMEYALARTLMDWGVTPSALVGHSLGEYVAATLAGIVDLPDALSLVQARAHAMEEAGPGSMLAVKLGVEEARALVTDDPDVDVAVINSPRDVVLSGRPEAVDRVAERLTEQGVGAQRLHTTRAFHSPMMVDAAARVGAQAEQVTLNPPQIPVVSNLTGEWLTDDQALDPTYWALHLRREVRFADDAATLLREGPAVYVELGPGRTLSGLVGTIAADVTPDAAPVAVPVGRHPLRTDIGDASVLLDGLGRLWTAGVEIDWTAYHATRSQRRIPLPGYAFARDRCWPTDMGGGGLPGSASSTAPAAADVKTSLDQWFHLPSWRRTLPPVLAAADVADSTDPVASVASSPENSADSVTNWLLLVSTEGVGARLGASLAASLRGRGAAVTTVEPDRTGGAGDAVMLGADADHATVAPTAAALESLLTTLAEQGRRPDRIVHLWSLSDDADADQAKELVADPRSPRGTLEATHLATALTRVAFAEPVQLWMVTAGAQQVDGERADALASTLLGPALVVSQENPSLACHVIDLGLDDLAQTDSESDLAHTILRECAATDPDDAFVVAWRGGRRWVRTYEQVEVGPGDLRLRAGGVYLVTGGLGRIGRTLAEHLASRQATVVLTTRGEVTDAGDLLVDRAGDAGEESTSEFLARLRAGDADVLLVQADAGREGDLARAVEATIERCGRLDGVFHAAGLAELTYLSDIDDALVEREFAPKVAGLLDLERAVATSREAGTGPEFVVLFSSIAGTLGGLAMSAYMGANRFMDAFAQAQPRRHGADWIAIAWDDWDFDYSTQQIEAYTATGADRFAMSPAEGLEALERVLALRTPVQLLVSTRPLAPRLQQWVDQPAPLPAGADGVDGADTKSGGADGASNGDAGGTGMEGRLIGVYKKVLGVDHVGVDDNFFELGGDSLLAAQILAQLRSTLGLAGQVQLSDVFTQPSVGQLAHHLESVAAK